MLACVLCNAALAADESLGRELQSSMIWAAEAPAGTQAYVAFRKSFELKTQPELPALLDIFADSRYLLWVNGEQILRGPCRFNPKRPEFDRIDVKPLLRPGKNVLTVLVHHYPMINGRIMRHAPGLTARLEIGGREILRTDSSWRCTPNTEYRPSPGAWSSIPDQIDGRLVTGTWTTADFNDSTWQPALAVDGNTWGALQPRSMPLPREIELTEVTLQASGRKLTAALPLELGGGASDSNRSGSSGNSVLLDLGRMALAYPVMELEADEGSVVQLQYALRCRDGHPFETYGIGTTYTARSGRQRFIAADQWCARYVTVTCTTGKVRILGLKMIDRHYPFERVGSFTCSEPLLTSLWDMAVNTIEATCDDAYGSDARERDEWLQDPAQPNFITTRVALAGPGVDGRKGFADPRLLKNLLRHAALAQLADGRLLATFPTDRAGDCHYVIEDYACQWVEALKLYVDSTGDRKFLREMWPTLTRQMQWFLDHRTPRGLLLAREYASFDNPLAYITCEGATMNAYFYQALRDADYLGRVLQQNPQAEIYATAAVELAAAYNKQLWNEAEGAYHSASLAEKVLGPTAHAQLLLVRNIYCAMRVPWREIIMHPPTCQCPAASVPLPVVVRLRAGLGS